MGQSGTELEFIAALFIAGAGIALALIFWRKLVLVRERLGNISDILDEISQGNHNRRILAHPDDMTSTICYKMNEIVHDFQEQIIDLRRAEETNKQLMTSLSHDLRTPLTTLIGYLDAVQKEIVFGSEREQYIETARIKSHEMKEYVDKLFEWFKLNSDEETFTTQTVEFSELTRMILKDWVPVFETAPLDFEIDIPEKRIEVDLDPDAYSRILNNLIHNVLAHSHATGISVSVSTQNGDTNVSVIDNGRGISKQDLPYIFQRLYKCDPARSQKGSGLGLSIVQQLTEKMGGTIRAISEPHERTEFIIKFPIRKNPG